jgi:hypothetical protein
MEHWLGNNRLLAVEAGGLLMLVAGLLCLRVKEDE